MVHVHKLFLVSCCPAWQALPVGRQGTGRIALEQRPLGLNKVRGLVKTRGPSAKSNAFSTVCSQGRGFLQCHLCPLGISVCLLGAQVIRGLRGWNPPHLGCPLLMNTGFPWLSLLVNSPHWQSVEIRGGLPCRSAMILGRKDFYLRKDFY